MEHTWAQQSESIMGYKHPWTTTPPSFHPIRSMTMRRTARIRAVNSTVGLPSMSTMYDMKFYQDKSISIHDEQQQDLVDQMSRQKEYQEEIARLRFQVQDLQDQLSCQKHDARTTEKQLLKELEDESARYREVLIQNKQDAVRIRTLSDCLKKVESVATEATQRAAHEKQRADAAEAETEQLQSRLRVIHDHMTRQQLEARRTQRKLRRDAAKEHDLLQTQIDSMRQEIEDWQMACGHLQLEFDQVANLRDDLTDQLCTVAYRLDDEINTNKTLRQTIGQMRRTTEQLERDIVEKDAALDWLDATVEKGSEARRDIAFTVKISSPTVLSKRLSDRGKKRLHSPVHQPIPISDPAKLPSWRKPLEEFADGNPFKYLEELEA